ncbi:MAG: DNA cytosine methyltransferase [Solidesulfovibrio sp. DCME]|uniref:DNA cytosine methyltransferase n=1 Tax=Solidesulfovibrio sp. DCME TaxID=3447380 RepID=UPI003D13E5F0
MTGPTFVDLFSGCGGLSLGLMTAGWQGLFAIEKSPDAFETLWHNLYHPSRQGFSWPGWLEIKPHTIDDFLEDYKENLKSLQGKVVLVAGGPPCQGFSFAGRRNPNDPRNMLPIKYVEVVKLIQPRFILIENVRGFTCGFVKQKPNGILSRAPSHAELISHSLKELGYEIFHEIVFSSEVGVPQLRQRLVMIAVKKQDAAFSALNGLSPFDLFHRSVKEFRLSKGLPLAGDITAKMALSDLETEGKKLVPCKDSSVPGFMQICYTVPRDLSSYQMLMRAGHNGTSPDCLRLPKHSEKVIQKFKLILETCERGKTISRQNREKLGLRKHHTVPLHPDRVAATVTTLPDDVVHYSEPRILTVREMARLQSFPDWFSFKGRYTTGNTDRRTQCPRYTQVGNAVPPLLAEALGKVILTLATIS